MTVSPAGLRLRRRRLRRLLRTLFTIQLAFTIGLLALLIHLGREERHPPTLLAGMAVALLLLPPSPSRLLGRISWIYLPLLFLLDLLHITLLLWSQPVSELSHGSLWALASIPMVLLAGRWWSYWGAIPLVLAVVAADALVLFLRLPAGSATPVFVFQAAVATLGALLSSGTEARIRRDLALREALSLSEERLLLANRLNESMAAQLGELDQLLREAARSPLDAGACAALGAAQQVAQEVKVALERSLPRVRPTPLGERTLPEVLARETESLCQQLAIACHFRYPGHLPPLRPAAAEFLFRTALEALANVRSHAAASSVTVDLDHDHVLVVLQVIDDGIGFDPASALSRHDSAWGLLSMRPRAEELGGSLAIQSAPGQGTRVEVRLPIAQW